MDLYNRLLVTFITLLINKEVLADDDDGLCYTAGFSENVEMDTDFAKVNFYLTPGPDGDDSKAGIDGGLTLKKDVPSGAKLELDIVKKTENGDEPAMAAVSDLCESLKDSTVPWYNLTQSLGMKECPVDAGDYALDDIFYIDLSWAKGAMNHEYVGWYGAFLRISDEQKNVMMTIPMELSISESEC